MGICNKRLRAVFDKGGIPQSPRLGGVGGTLGGADAGQRQQRRGRRAAEVRSAPAERGRRRGRRRKMREREVVHGRVTEGNRGHSRAYRLAKINPAPLPGTARLELSAERRPSSVSSLGRSACSRHLCLDKGVVTCKFPPCCSRTGNKRGKSENTLEFSNYTPSKLHKFKKKLNNKCVVTRFK